MKYNTIKFNDIANGPGIGVSFFVQGCSRQCKGCFNQETWDFNGGQEFTNATLDSIIKGLTANNISRHLSILGGEPLALQNLKVTTKVIQEVRNKLPNTIIYLWTGYIYEELKQEVKDYLKQNIDFLIDGPYIEEERDITLSMRGSRNQNIIDLKTGEIINDKI